MMLSCPHCLEMTQCRTIDVQTSDKGQTVRRRRHCMVCDKRWTTYERREQRPLKVVKRNGRREGFDKTKLLQSIMCATHGLTSQYEDEELAAEILAGLRSDFERETSTTEIANRVMTALRGSREVAYIRYAAGYREFKDATEFRALLKEFTRRAPSG